MRFVSDFGRYVVINELKANNSVILKEAKVERYDHKKAFDKGYNKVLALGSKVIIKMIEILDYNENEELLHKKIGQDQHY